MLEYQPSFGNGGSPRGRRITDDTPEAFEKGLGSALRGVGRKAKAFDDSAYYERLRPTGGKPYSPGVSNKHDVPHRARSSKYDNPYQTTHGGGLRHKTPSELARSGVDPFGKRDNLTPREHDRKSQRAANVALGGGLVATGGAVGEHIAHTSSWPRSPGKLPLYGSRAAQVAGSATFIGGLGVAAHHQDKARKKRLAMLDRALENGSRQQSVGKSRYYDPESRRQRRLGMYEAALAGGGVAGLALGVRGARKTTKSVEAGMKMRPELKRKKIVALSGRDMLALGGGAASGTGAIVLNRHAESRAGRPMN